ncbi:hypothetical protein PIB30_035305 [Stylosanthes scabra]|uniref:Uncharacterized protein n=1 Tax=Stylosanthes scabra TaxID=79078 RepID=A0ABU6QCS1_9FABA|nr:hypothetical protein [Stylosanthes scabra]
MDLLSSLDRMADIASEAVEEAQETCNRDDPLMVAMEPGETHDTRDDVQNGSGPTPFSAAEILEIEFENPEEASRFYEQYSRRRNLPCVKARS